MNGLRTGRWDDEDKKKRDAFYDSFTCSSSTFFPSSLYVYLWVNVFSSRRENRNNVTLCILTLPSKATRNINAPFLYTDRQQQQQKQH